MSLLNINNPHPIITYIDHATMETDGVIHTVFPAYTIQIAPFEENQFHCTHWSNSGQSLQYFYETDDLNEALEAILKRATKTN